MLIENIRDKWIFLRKKKKYKTLEHVNIYIYILFKVMQINKFIFPRSLFIF